MTRDETKKIIHIISATYPNFKTDAISDLIDAWSFFLEDYSYNEIALALKTYVTSNGKGFPPSVSELIALTHKASEMTQLTELEAWALVRRAISKGNYYAEDEYNKLPPLVQKAVGAPGNIRDWAQSDIAAIDNVIASNFQRTYRSVVSRSLELEKMPAEARARIEQIMKEPVRWAIEGE